MNSAHNPHRGPIQEYGPRT